MMEEKMNIFAQDQPDKIFNEQSLYKLYTLEQYRQIHVEV